MSWVPFSQAANLEAVQREKITDKNQMPKVKRTPITEGFINVYKFDFGTQKTQIKLQEL